MSMISSLIDELNKSADEWNGSNMFELARMCREAADTITELRGALQVASVDYRHLQDENAKLREQIHWLKQGDILHVLTDQEYIDQSERERLMQVSIDALDKENAKLRELVRDMHRAICGLVVLGDDYAGEYEDRLCALDDRMRELGVDA